jgi:hypothetical protein
MKKLVAIAIDASLALPGLGIGYLYYLLTSLNESVVVVKGGKEME